MADSWRERADEIKRDNLRQDRDDLNNEVAGRDTGRIKRFVSAEPIGSQPTNSDDDNFILDAFSQLLTMEQQRQVENLNRQFALYETFARTSNFAVMR